MTAHAPAALRHLYDDALATLLGWRAPDAAQESLRRSFLSVLGSDPCAVSKDGPPAHLTASCLVMSPDGEQVLLHRHRKAGMWLQFGGHLEAADAGLWQAAAREAREESGLEQLDLLADPIDLDRHLLGARFGTCAEHLDVRYLALADAAAAPVISDESDEVAWWPADALPPGAGADLPRLITVARQRLP